MDTLPEKNDQFEGIPSPLKKMMDDIEDMQKKKIFGWLRPFFQSIESRLDKLEASQEDVTEEEEEEQPQPKSNVYLVGVID
jgi:hypothetical protein